jgi:hypothetical protein
MLGRLYRQNGQTPKAGERNKSGHTNFWPSGPKACASLLWVIMLASGLAAPSLAAHAAGRPGGKTPGAAAGTIAYIRNETELHLIQPDGSNDRLLWSAPLVGGVQSGVRYPA